jgi:hypothetical protein
MVDQWEWYVYIYKFPLFMKEYVLPYYVIKIL